MLFLMTYWKQLGIVILLSLAILGAYLRGHEAGEAKIQARWDAQKVLDLQAVAKAEAKTDTINLNSEKVTQDENTKLNTSDIATTDYYSSHPVPIVAKCPAFPPLPNSLTKTPPTQYLVPTTKP